MVLPLTIWQTVNKNLFSPGAISEQIMPLVPLLKQKTVNKFEIGNFFKKPKISFLSLKLTKLTNETTRKDDTCPPLPLITAKGLSRPVHWP